MRLRERTDVGPRCPYCREGVDGSAVACPGCGVRMHEACGKELGRCPTMGCGASGAAAGVSPEGRVGEAMLVQATPLSRAAWLEQLIIAVLLLSIGVSLVVAPAVGNLGGLLRPVGVATIALVLLIVGTRLSDRARARRFAGSALSVQPFPAQAGAPVRLTLTLGPRVQALVQHDSTATLRAELRRVRHGVAADLTVPLWRAVRLVGADALGDGQAVFDFEFPAPPRLHPVRWEVHVSCETRAGGYCEQTWELPVRD